MMTITVSQTLRGRVLVLLFAVFLVLETVATASDSKRVSVDLSNFARPQSDKQEIDARLLRSHDQGDKHEEEERMDTVKISQLIGGRQTAGEAFKLLKLDDGMEKLLSNPNLRTFMGFIDDYNVQNPGNGATVIKSVTATYGDDVAAAVLQRATKVSATKVTAEKLLGDLRVLWLTDKRSPLDVFKLLKLDDVATNPLDNAALDAWESYLNLFNYVNRESGKKITKLETFRAAYGGDDALAKMLHQAARVSTTKEAARNLLRDQRNRWWGEKRTPLDVFKLLNLDKVASNPLASPALDVWNSYMKSFNYWSRGTGRETTTIDTFTAAYGDAALAKIINTARTVPQTEKMATALQLQQFALWMRKRGNPNNIYTHVFKLDPKLKTIPEPYQTILNHYHSFYKQFIREVK